MRAEDWPALEPVVRGVVETGEAHVDPPGPTSQELRALWLAEPPG